MTVSWFHCDQNEITGSSWLLYGQFLLRTYEKGTCGDSWALMAEPRLALPGLQKKRDSAGWGETAERRNRMQCWTWMKSTRCKMWNISFFMLTTSSLSWLCLMWGVLKLRVNYLFALRMWMDITFKWKQDCRFHWNLLCNPWWSLSWKMWVYVCTLGTCVVPLSNIIACIPTGAERIGTGSVLKSLFAICRKAFFFLMHL